MSIQYAIKIAESNRFYEKWPFGCVIKKGGAVQSVGFNRLKSEPTYLDNHSTCSTHAEVHALRQMNYKAHGCVMFIARAMRNGSVGLAKPCNDCQQAIISSGIKRVTYTIDDSTQGVWKP